MSDMQFTSEDLKAILVGRIGLADGDVPDDPATTFADLGLDSLAIVEIQLALQQRFSFDIPDQDAHLITTLGEAVDYVNRRLAMPEAA